MNIKVFLRSSKKEFVNVCFRLRDTTYDLHYKSDIVISPDDWDEKTQFIKKTSGNILDERKRRLIKLTDTIEARKRLIRDLFLEQNKPEMITSEWLVDAIDRKLNPCKYIETQNELPLTVLTYIRFFVENFDKRRDKKTGRSLSPSTKKQYVTTERHIIDFAKSQNKEDFNFSDIDESFYNEFVEYMTGKSYFVKFSKGIEVNQSEKYTMNAIGKYIRSFKVMIADANNSDANLSKFYVFNEDVDNVYLNESELQILKELDLSKNLHLDRVRDWFLLLCWTGCRFSDLEKIGKTDIKDGFITFRQQKTNNKVTIPLHPVVSDILTKYNFKMPEQISNQKFNEYVKEVCKLAQIDSKETFTRTVGGKLLSENQPKYTLISSHTGRRSFCTNMYKRGLPTLMIMSISGHHTEKSFLKYIKVKQEEHAEMMAKKWKEIYK